MKFLLTKAHTLPSHTSRDTSQNLAKGVLFPTQKEIQFFFSFPSEKIKTPDTHTNPIMTVKHSKDNGLQTRWTRTPVCKSGLAKVAVQYSAVRQLAEVNQSLVLRINPDSYRNGVNRHLRQARNRCASLYRTTIKSSAIRLTSEPKNL